MKGFPRFAFQIFNYFILKSFTERRLPEEGVSWTDDTPSFMFIIQAYLSYERRTTIQVLQERIELLLKGRDRKSVV